VLLAAIFVRLGMDTSIEKPQSLPPVREIRGVDPSSVTIISPEDASTITDRTSITWTPVERALFYEVRITDQDGALLWEQRTTSATLALESAGLKPGTRGFLLVTAHLPDNRTLRSRAVSFSTP
jgi:hypothetical protein